MDDPRFTEAQERVLTRYGVEAVSRFVPSDAMEGRAHVLVAGTGPKVLVVNGIGLPGAMWAPLLAHLGDVTVHAVDGPGFGLTDAPSDLCCDLRSRAVAFLDEVADGLGLHGPLVIMASSLGSLWSTWLALDRPDRVRALVHVGCPALAPGTSAPAPMRLLSVPHLSRVLMALQPPSPRQAERVGTMVGEDLSRAPEIRDLIVATERGPSYGPAFRGLLRALLRPRGARRDVALTTAELARVTQPVQLLWGAHDPFGDLGAAEVFRDALPDTELHVVAGGHAPWLDDAEAIAGHVRSFLTRRTATA